MNYASILKKYPFVKKAYLLRGEDTIVVELTHPVGLDFFQMADEFGKTVEVLTVDVLRQQRPNALQSATLIYQCEERPKPENKVWDCQKEDYIPMPNRMAAFLTDISIVCKEHGLMLALNKFDEIVVEEYTPERLFWLTSAAKNYEE